MTEPTEETRIRADHLQRTIGPLIGRRLNSRDIRSRRRERDLYLKLQDPTYPQNEKRQIQIQRFLDKTKSLIEPQRRYTKNNVDASDFKIIKTIIKHKCGDVTIVRYKHNKKIYAMKRLLKQLMIPNTSNYPRDIVAETDIMKDISNSWIVKMHHCFHDITYLYIVMDYCYGGDLMALLIQHNVLSEDQTRFYITEISAALRRLHELGFVYRDLKPHKILIDNDGHIKLSDISLYSHFKSKNDQYLKDWRQFVNTKQEENMEILKHSNHRVMTLSLRKSVVLLNGYFREYEEYLKGQIIPATLNGICFEYYYIERMGTPEYIAEEVFGRKGYNTSVDLWSLGVIMMECLIGYNPFYGYDPLEICTKIVKYKEYFRIPNDAKISKNAVDLLDGLICNSWKRLRWDKLQQHQWFKGINWNDLKSLKPPFIPKAINDFEEEQETQNEDEIMQQSLDPNKIWSYTFNKHDFQYSFLQ